MEPTPALVTIGHCKGCNRMQRLDDGVCRDCLADPKRGRKWAELAHRCRTDRAVARQVYALIESDRGRALFVEWFGDPTAES